MDKALFSALFDRISEWAMDNDVTQHGFELSGRATEDLIERIGAELDKHR